MSLKKWRKKLVRKILHIRNYIFLESRPDLGDNTKALFDEFLKRGINCKYKFVWWVDDNRKKYLPTIKNVIYVDRRNLMNRLRFTYYNIVSRCLIYCNISITKYFDDQILIYLGHISPLKDTGIYFVQSPVIDYCIAQSQHFKDCYNYETKGTKCEIVALGYPRTDELCKPPKTIKHLFRVPYEKIIVWYPTFRQNIHGVNISASSVALPIIHDKKAAIELNNFLRENKTIIVIKPHFSQDISYFKDVGLDHIIFITDDFYWDNGISSYEFVSSCDALVTDYSSIYYDYTLRDKPIAVIWEDIEEYKKKPGFAVDVNYYFKGAEKIYTVEDFKCFVEHVVKNEDILSEERKEIRDLVNLLPDGKSSERVANFIIEKANL